MKRILFLLLIILGFSTKGICGKCDTIDMYWIYYNDSIWAKLNQNMFGYPMTLDTKKVNKNDSISISYETDTPCIGCWNSIQIEDSVHHIIKENKGENTWAKISFSVKELIEIANTQHLKDLYFYYNNRSSSLLLKLKLE